MAVNKKARQLKNKNYGAQLNHIKSYHTKGLKKKGKKEGKHMIPRDKKRKNRNNNRKKTRLS